MTLKKKLRDRIQRAQIIRQKSRLFERICDSIRRRCIKNRISNV